MCALIAIVCVVIAEVFTIPRAKEYFTEQVGSNRSATFPDQPGDLTEYQQTVFQLVKAEYEAQPGMLKYTEGIDEPWCADFVSWIAKEAGTPVVNPNSGSWRISGVFTLTEFFQQHQQFHGEMDFQPQVGDVVLYDDDSRFGQHTNFVVAVDDATMTTVGGNEAPNEILLSSQDLDNRAGIVGFVRLFSW